MNKKHLLIVSMCLAFTLNSAFAKNAKVGNMQSEKTTVSKISASNSAPVSSLINKDGFISPNSPSIKMPGTDVRKRFEDRRTKERESLYNDLNLTANQRVIAAALDSQIRSESGRYRARVQIEARKLKDLKMKHASFIAIYKQKSALRSAQKNVDKYMKSSKEAFGEILTSEQKAKFKKIDAQKKKDMQDFRKNHKPGKYVKPEFGLKQLEGTGTAGHIATPQQKNGKVAPAKVAQPSQHSQAPEEK